MPLFSRKPRASRFQSGDRVGFIDARHRTLHGEVLEVDPKEPFVLVRIDSPTGADWRRRVPESIVGMEGGPEPTPASVPEP